jgi:6-phosphogluconolactonase (cycloisomerase 2 family)
MTRREWLAGAAAAAATHAQSGGSRAPLFAYVGCYTTADRYARGDGIHVYRVEPETAAWTPVQQLGNLVNPSFLVADPDGRVLYSVHGDETYATAFAVDRESGRITAINRAASGGRNGVHQAIDPSGRYLLVANYSSGGIAVMPIRPDGGLEDASLVVPLPGQPGPHRIEQASSHPHQILFDPSGKFVVVPDKALDRVFVFRFDPATGKLSPTAQGAGVARSGSGPRHAAFHPTLTVLWVLNEISNTVTTWFWEAERGHLRAAQILSTLPPDYTGENTASEIAVGPGGRVVYCSNRGHDSIAAFSVDPGTGLLASPTWTLTQGRTPRFIGFEPARRFLYATNEQSDTIVPFRTDGVRLTRVGAPVRTGSPVSIAFIGG